MFMPFFADKIPFAVTKCILSIPPIVLFVSALLKRHVANETATGLNWLMARGKGKGLSQ